MFDSNEYQLRIVNSLTFASQMKNRHSRKPPSARLSSAKYALDDFNLTCVDVNTQNDSKFPQMPSVMMTGVM